MNQNTRHSFIVEHAKVKIIYAYARIKIFDAYAKIKTFFAYVKIKIFFAYVKIKIFFACAKIKYVMSSRHCLRKKSTVIHIDSFQNWRLSFAPVFSLKFNFSVISPVFLNHFALAVKLILR